ncbi:MAG: NUDIX hydrolase [Rhodobacterales bacterium]|nr:NUDIX hydrolase [Rhodobacterales bacterium]NCT12979.1 NUDIX hydrolase [Rhodobacterales bacterium]
MIRRYGDPVKRGQRYAPRPGAYAILLRGRDLLLTFQLDPHPEVQLPGGGIDPGESPVRALHREVYEETGWHIAAPRRLGAFRRFAYMPEYDKWAEKLCHIFLATPTLRMGPPAEAGHTALWCPIGEAGDVLANEGERDFVAALRRML